MTEKVPLLNPAELPVVNPDGTTTVYILSDFSATEGRRIECQYPTSVLKMDNYELNEELMYRIMRHVAVVKDGRQIRLETKALVDNHVANSECLLKIEKAMLEKNFSFFRDGRIFSLFDSLVQLFTKSLLEMLTQSLGLSSPKVTPPSTN